MIVRDEVKHLGACLDSIERFVDEIVIVDTGSTDGTWELVQERAHVCEQIEWTGFADARNRSLELCSGEYILIIDADERWIEGPIEQMVKAMDKGIDGVVIIIRNELPEGQLLQADQTWQIRMFRNLPEIRWTGKVHNQVLISIEKLAEAEGREVCFDQIPVVFYHTGYALPADEIQRKYKVRLSFLHHELDVAKDDKHRNYYKFQLSNAYFMLREYDKALHWAKEVDLEHLTDENRFSLALMSVHTSHVVVQDKKMATEWAKLMMNTRPDEPISFLMMGLSHLGENNKAAFLHLGAALSLAQIPDMGYKYTIDPHFVAGAAGEAALAIKRYGDAKELFRFHLSKYQTEHIKRLEAGIVPVGPDGKAIIQPGQVNGQAPLAGGSRIQDSRRTD